MNLWVMQDKIKRGLITYEVGDEVVCFHRKSNRHPRPIKDNIVYTIKSIDLDGHINVSNKSLDGIGWDQPIRVHKIYMIHKNVLRDIKLSSILD
jgi:hypothetical protein